MCDSVRLLYLLTYLLTYRYSARVDTGPAPARLQHIADRAALRAPTPGKLTPSRPRPIKPTPAKATPRKPKPGEGASNTADRLQQAGTSGRGGKGLHREG